MWYNLAMLTDIVSNPKYKKFITILSKFYSSPLYIALIALITVLSETLGLELPCYYLYMIIAGIIPALFCYDMRSLIAPFAFGYMTVSTKSNDFLTGTSLFKYPFLYHFYTIIAVIVVTLVSRFIYDAIKKKLNPYPEIITFMLPLLVALPLGGLFYNGSTYKDSIFGLAVSASFIVPFFFIYFQVDYKTLRKDYFAYLLFFLGYLLVFQILGIYILNLDRIKEGTFDINYFFTGWGIKNNIGGMLALALPGPIYLAMKKKFSPLYFASNVIFVLFVIMTESRAAIFVGGLVEIAMLIYFFVKGKGKRIPNLILLGSMLTVAIIIIATNFDFFKRSFQVLYNTIINFSIDNLSSGRLYIWAKGINEFKQNPLFGTGYYKLNDEFIPDYIQFSYPFRYHNTIIQLLASSGIVGLVTYLIHRVHTGFMFFRRYNERKLFLTFAGSIMIGLSLFDCHLFNIGPGLLYSIFLAFASFEDNIVKEERYLKSLDDAIN